MEIKVVFLGDESESKKSYLISKVVADHDGKSLDNSDEHTFRLKTTPKQGSATKFRLVPLSITPRFKLSKSHKSSEDQSAVEHYNSAHSILIVYDVCKSKSFDKAKKYMDQFIEHRDNLHSQDIKAILVGHKSKDYKDFNREIKGREARDYATKCDFEFRELSVSDHSIHSLFRHLASTITPQSPPHHQTTRPVPRVEDPFHKSSRGRLRASQSLYSDDRKERDPAPLFQSKSGTD